MSASPTWLRDPAAGNWLVSGHAALSPRASSVAGRVPGTFEAVARVLHPLRYGDDVAVRWTDVAEAAGMPLVANSMAEDLLARASRRERGSWLYTNQPLGLQQQVWRALAPILSAHTSSARLILAYWEAHADPLPPDDHTLKTAALNYVLAAVTADEAAESLPFCHWRMPCMVWPEDRAWFLHSDIEDFSSYLAAPAATVDALVRSTSLEVMRAQLDDPAG